MAAALLLLLPFVIAFFAGGYFTQPRLIAGLAAWVLAVVAVWAGPWPDRLGRPGWTAAGGICGLVVLCGLSILWAPSPGVAQADLQRLLLYLPVFVAAVALSRGVGCLRLVEGAFVCGSLAVMVYALLPRLLPGVVKVQESLSAGGRLEQPLTYWNATGALAAVGLVLALRVCADPDRPRRAAALAGGAAVPMVLALYLSFSRGALFAALAGLVALLVITRQRSQFTRALVPLGFGLAVSGLAAALPGVRALEGAPGTRQLQGALMLAALVLASVLAGSILLRWPLPEEDTRLRWSAALVAALLAVCAGGLAVAASESGPQNRDPRFGADNRRLVSVDSTRYDYWAVAIDMAAASPLVGEGSGAFRESWVRERPGVERARDAHSLYIETAAELGLLGLACLACLFGGVAVSAGRLFRRHRGAAAGCASALVVLAVHAGLDWDWEVPTLGVTAMILAGVLVGVSRRPGRGAQAETAP